MQPKEIAESADTNGVRRRLPLLFALACLLLAPAGSAKVGPSWAQSQIKAVVSAGLMGKNVATFHPDDPLTRDVLESLVGGLTHQSLATSYAKTPVTMAGLDARLVSGLGLSDAAALFGQAARKAGLAPPSRFGAEAVARLLGLRTNHPAAQDELELLPNETATRAETAYSAAQILRFGGWETQNARALAGSFVLPTFTPWQRRILSTAVSFVGYPYVWGGESELPESPFGHQAHGGFDCPASSGASTSSRPIRTSGHSPACSEGERPSS